MRHDRRDGGRRRAAPLSRRMPYGGDVCFGWASLPATHTPATGAHGPNGPLRHPHLRAAISSKSSTVANNGTPTVKNCAHKTHPTPPQALPSHPLTRWPPPRSRLRSHATPGPTPPSPARPAQRAPRGTTSAGRTASESLGSCCAAIVRCCCSRPPEPPRLQQLAGVSLTPLATETRPASGRAARRSCILSATRAHCSPRTYDQPPVPALRSRCGLSRRPARWMLTGLLGGRAARLHRTRRHVAGAAPGQAGRRVAGGPGDRHRHDEARDAQGA